LIVIDWWLNSNVVTAVTRTTVRLLEAEPDLGSFLSPKDRELASRVSVPVRTVEGGEIDLESMLDGGSAFGAIVLEGMLLHRALLGEQAALRLLGPGDMVSVVGTPGSALLVQRGYRAAGPAALAILDDHALLMIQRFPALAVGLQARMADQNERLATQLAICQLPRVEDRVLAMMWLLAESWGRVTASGTVLPLALTHDALGELVGAKRPTVTLALRELSERGAIVRRDRGWLLLEELPHAASSAPLAREPEVIENRPSPWQHTTQELDEPLQVSLLGTVRALQADHARNAARYTDRARLIDLTRRHSQRLRAEIRERRATTQAPS
jgi:CRP-like cAMP-binding protein